MYQEVDSKSIIEVNRRAISILHINFYCVGNFKQCLASFYVKDMLHWLKWLNNLYEKGSWDEKGLATSIAMCFQMFWREVVHTSYYLTSLSNFLMQFVKANVNNLSAASKPRDAFKQWEYFLKCETCTSALGNIDFSPAARRNTILLNWHILKWESIFGNYPVFFVTFTHFGSSCFNFLG